MATTGELLWAGLLDRRDDLKSIASSGDFVRLEVHKEGSVAYVLGSDVLLKDFKLGALSFVFPSKSRIGIRLVFTRLTFGRRGVTSVVILKWPHYWVTRKGITVDGFLVKDQFIVRFPYRADDIVVKFSNVFPSGVRNPLDDSVEKFALHKPVRLSRITLQRVANISIAHVLRYASVKRRILRAKRRFDWGNDQRLLNPLVVVSKVPTGSESFGGPWIATTTDLEVFRRTVGSSTRTPGFRSKRKSKLPVNDFNVTITQTEPNSCAYFRHLTLDPSTRFNNVYSPVTVFDDGTIPTLPDFDPALYNRSVARLRSAAEQEVNNLAVDVAQFRQTVNMIADSATRITKSLLSLRRGDLYGATYHLYHNKAHRLPPRFGPSNSAGSLANNWLALQYGWKPLLQDIDGAMRSLANYVQNNDLLRTVRSNAKSETKSLWPVTFRNQAAEVGSPVPSTWPTLAMAERVAFNQVRMVCNFVMEDRTKSFLSQTGFTSPVNLAWELLPFSFVVDWFLPVGPYLESLSSWEGMSFRSGSVTYFARVTDSAQVRLFNTSLIRTPSYTTRLNANWDRQTVFVLRQKLTSFPSPVFPQFKSPISTVHALNALALLRAVFRS